MFTAKNKQYFCGDKWRNAARDCALLEANRASSALRNDFHMHKIQIARLQDHIRTAITGR